MRRKPRSSKRPNPRHFSHAHGAQIPIGVLASRPVSGDLQKQQGSLMVPSPSLAACSTWMQVHLDYTFRSEVGGACPPASPHAPRTSGTRKNLRPPGLRERGNPCGALPPNHVRAGASFRDARITSLALARRISERAPQRDPGCRWSGLSTSPRTAFQAYTMPMVALHDHRGLRWRDLIQLRRLHSASTAQRGKNPRGSTPCDG